MSKFHMAHYSDTDTPHTHRCYSFMYTRN